MQKAENIAYYEEVIDTNPHLSAFINRYDTNLMDNMETVNEQPRIKKIMTNRVKKTFVKDSPIR